MATPTPVKSDLRFSARVDYFTTAHDALLFAGLKRAEGFNVQGGGDLTPRQNSGGPYAGLYGVHWIDRQGEGWYG